MQKKILSLTLVAFLIVSFFNSTIINAEVNDTSGGDIQSNDEVVTATNMEDLPLDLLEDIEVSEYDDTGDSIVTEEEDYSAEIDFESNSIDFTDVNGNNIEVSVEDEDLEFKENNDGSIVFENKEENYQVENQILDGGFRQLYTLESEVSPKEIKIDIDLENGQYLKEEDGLYYIKNENGETIYNIGKPWAVDSKGNFIDTHYTLKDNAIYQNINYTGNSYPVKADPLFCSDTINNTSTKWNSSYDGGKGTFSVYTRTCTKAYITANWALGIGTLGAISQASIMGDMWSEVTADADFKKHISSSKRGRIKDQFICHAANPLTIYKSSWNLEPWRPDKSLSATYAKACNPK
ncbi:DUF2599 domain-containing protein [Niallia taxi]|uniref:DUF2599 domain-containing protein n=1 Tax=Niallia taxi TaxID=2499688 RepID=UPI00317B2BA3